MLKTYIKAIVKSELEKQKLNYIYGLTRSYNLNTVNNEERQQLNKEISHLKDQIDSANERKKYLKLQIYQLKQENKELKLLNEKLNQENKELLSSPSDTTFYELQQENINLNNILDKYAETLLEAIKIKDSLQNENETLKKENKELSKMDDTMTVDENGTIESLFNKQLKHENEKLKKELLDSKNGLNGANHVIKNNKEWINSQDKKIKELEEEIRCLKSDNEDLQYNLRRKSTQKIQLETKNKCSEEKLTKISNVISLYITNDITFMRLMTTIGKIKIILKES